MADELNDVKRPLEEQKTIDRARLLMMEQLKLSEAEAYRLLQKRAMDNNIRIAEMADLVVKAASSNQSAIYKAKLQQMSM
jgi:AmiR/NasT family two-component response regulator